jgi:hypothetical protein
MRKLKGMEEYDCNLSLPSRNQPVMLPAYIRHTHPLICPFSPTAIAVSSIRLGLHQDANGHLFLELDQFVLFMGEV